MNIPKNLPNLGAAVQPKATFHFPKKFSWGAAYPAYLSPHQLINNNWENWINISPVQNAEGGNFGQSWKDDFERAHTLGLHSLILNVDWSRIQPSPQRWNENMIDHYRKIMINLLEKNIQPFIILQHFSEPNWFFEMGGWENQESIAFYLAYVKKIVTALAELCQHWITFYEPNLYILNAYGLGKYPPGTRSIRSTGKVFQHILQAHCLAYSLIHQIQNNTHVSITSNFKNVYPARNQNLLDHLSLPLFNRFYNKIIHRGMKYNFNFRKWFFNKKNSPFDFVLFSFYQDQEIKLKLNKPFQFEEMNTAQGLIPALSWATSFQKPVYIVGTNPQPDSAAYLLHYLHKVWKTANLNPYIRGYFYHSLVDGFEWENYFDLSLGLFKPNTKGFNQSLKESSEVYRNVIHTNSITHELVNRVSPNLINKLFP